VGMGIPMGIFMGKGKKGKGKGKGEIHDRAMEYGQSV